MLTSHINDGNQALTPKYCAPEWFINKRERGPPSDIWSFGCILTQITTYSHDRTMLDFESFRASNTKAEKEWTYHESLPAVEEWLQLLSQHYDYSGRDSIQKEHIDMIRQMLLPSPRERPCAADIVTKLDSSDYRVIQQTDKILNDSRGLAFKHSPKSFQYKYPDLDATANFVFKIEDCNESPNELHEL
jgi:serine/threonine protein kinase